jgi:site-specific DNA recombinase
MMSQRACLYLRSSKDRSDVSIDAQRRELQKLAGSRNYLIIQEYTDVVESAKDEQRPGFQALLRDLKSSHCEWTVLMMVDTSRLSRRRYAAQVFKHEAKKRGVEIVYSKVPEVDPITNVLLEAVFESFDEVHTLMSKEKGLAGMAENVKQGFRAGGRAPRGYVLK